MNEEIPQHYMPQTQGLELMTHPAVADAYTLFWSEVCRLADRVKQRRAARQEAVLDAMQEQENTEPTRAAA